MWTTTPTPSQRGPFELRFQSLFNAGRGYAFPCDADGHVDMDAMSERSRNSYLYARAVMGREFNTPEVRSCIAA